MRREPVDVDAGAGGRFSLLFRRDGDCLEVRASGRIVSMAAVADFFVRIGKELQRTGASRVLILDDTRSKVPDEAQFRQLATLLAGAGFDRVRTAFVDVRGNSIGRIEIGEVVARDAGYLLRIFDNERMGRIWLRYGSE